MKTTAGGIDSELEDGVRAGPANMTVEDIGTGEHTEVDFNANGCSL